MKIHLLEMEKAFWDWLQKQGYRQNLKTLCHHVRFFCRFLENQGVMDSAYYLEIDSITQETLTAYQTYLANSISRDSGKPILVGTQIMRLQVLKILFRFLQENGWMKSSPEVVYPQPPQRAPRGVLTVPEIRKLLAAPDPATPLGLRDRLMMELLWITGITAGELFALEVGDISSGVRLRRNGQLVPIGKGARRRLADYLGKVRPKWFGATATPILFLNQQGNPLAHYTFKAEVLRRHRMKARISKKVSVQSFRHTLITEILRAGNKLERIGKMLEHDTPAQSQRFLKVVEDDLRTLVAQDALSESGRPRINYHTRWMNTHYHV